MRRHRARFRPALTGAALGPLTVSAVAGFMALIPSGTPAQAKTVKFPEAKPQVAMDVPDDWSVSFTDFGLELRSPQKDSYIVASILKRDKPAVDAWAKKASDKMILAGVSFSAGAAPAKPAASAPPIPSAPAAQKADATFTFSGAPSLAPPAKAPPVETALSATAPKGETLEEMIAPTVPAAAPKMPFRVAVYSGASLAGQPVDVQLVNFSLSKTELFLLEQESGPADDRAVTIVKSVRPAE